MAFAITVGPFDSGAENGAGVATTTLPLCTAGNQVIVGARWYHSSVTLSTVVVGGQSATIHGTPTKNSDFDGTWQFASLGNVSSSGDKTVTVTWSGGMGGSARFYAAEVSGGDTAAFFDAEAGATGNSTNPTVNVTTVANGCMIAAGMSSTGGDGTAGTGYTGIALTNVFWFDEGEYDLDVGSAGGKTANFTASSGQWVCKCAAFKPADGGAAASATPSPTLLLLDVGL